MMAAPVGRALAPFDKIRSPCRGICELSGPSNCSFCVGCGRTIEEIARWATYTEEEKAFVLRKLAAKSKDS
jgi:predicted Fe-S protein YdhL (DUF1289 family)